MATVVILGAGLMGTAFSRPLADNGNHVRLVGTHLDTDIIEELHESGYHPRLQTHIDASVIPYTVDRLEEALHGADLVVLGVNSLGVKWAADMLGPLMRPETPLLMLTKGMEGSDDALAILPHVLQQRLPPELRAGVAVTAVGGPSIAGELAARRHTSVLVTGRDSALLTRLADLMRTVYYHVWTSTDMIGVEVSVAMKNVYALAVGLVNGLLEQASPAENDAVMHNLSAALFAQGLREIAYMVDFAGGDPASAYGLAGAGDLYVTSMGGRNGRMGRWLGMGVPYSRAKATYMPDDTIEGAALATAIGPTVERLVAQGRLERRALPLLHAMIEIVCHDAPPHIPWDDFFYG